jgi:hypothetical protein
MNKIRNTLTGSLVASLMVVASPNTTYSEETFSLEDLSTDKLTEILGDPFFNRMKYVIDSNCFGGFEISDPIFVDTDLYGDSRRHNIPKDQVRLYVKDYFRTPGGTFELGHTYLVYMDAYGPKGEIPYLVDFPVGRIVTKVEDCSKLA